MDKLFKIKKDVQQELSIVLTIKNSEHGLTKFGEDKLKALKKINEILKPFGEVEN